MRLCMYLRKVWKDAAVYLSKNIIQFSWKDADVYLFKQIIQFN